MHKKTAFLFLMIWLAVGILLFINSGCDYRDTNLFSFLHSPGSANAGAEVLISDAESAMRKGRYDAAIEYYEKALAKDPDNALALYGHAKATLKANNLDLTFIISSVVAGEQNIQGLLMPGTTEEEINKLLQTSGTVTGDLQRIADGDTDGSISADSPAINFDLGIYMCMNAVAGLLDTNEDGVYDDDDLCSFGTDSTTGNKEILIKDMNGGTKTFGEINQMTAEELDAYKLTVDTQTVVNSLNNAVTQISSAMTYMEKSMLLSGGGASDSVTSIINAMDALKQEIEDMKLLLGT